MNSIYTKIKHRVFGKLGAIEIALLGIAAAVIQLQIEGILWQSIATASVILGFSIFYIPNKQKANFSYSFVYKSAGIFMLALAYLFLLPSASHAVLLGVDQTIVPILQQNVQPAEVGEFLGKSVVGLMWIGRMVLLGILINMGLKINEGRGQEKSWKELLQDPTIFIISVGLIDRIGNFIITGAFN